MRRIDVKRKQIDIDDFKQRHASEQDVSQLIRDNVIIYEDDKPIILYMRLDDYDTTDLRKAVKKINYTKGARLNTNYKTGRVFTQSAIFGYRPRSPIRKDVCSASSMAYKDNKNHNIISSYAKVLSDIYEKYFIEDYTKHLKIVNEKVRPEWRIQETLFTSGIVNKDTPLKYHHDAGNFKGGLSTMIGFKEGIAGGKLAFPEFDIKLEIEDNTLAIFDGQSIVHGVTPIIKMTEDAYRYTIVYYSLEQMWKCSDVNTELNAVRKRKVDKENNRIDQEHIKKLEQQRLKDKGKNHFKK